MGAGLAGRRASPVRVLILGYLDRHDGARVPRLADGRLVLRGRLLDDGGYAVFALPEHPRGEVHALPRTDAALAVDTGPHGRLHEHRPMPVQVINTGVEFLVFGRTRWMTAAVTSIRPQAWTPRATRRPVRNQLGRALLPLEPPHGAHPRVDPVIDELDRAEPEDDDLRSVWGVPHVGVLYQPVR